jgi:hypothetical protein
LLNILCHKSLQEAEVSDARVAADSQLIFLKIGEVWGSTDNTAVSKDYTRPF